MNPLALQAGLLTWLRDGVIITRGRGLVAFLLLGEALEGPLVGLHGLSCLLSHVGFKHLLDQFEDLPALSSGWRSLFEKVKVLLDSPECFLLLSEDSGRILLWHSLGGPVSAQLLLPFHLVVELQLGFKL